MSDQILIFYKSTLFNVMYTKTGAMWTDSEEADHLNYQMGIWRDSKMSFDCGRALQNNLKSILALSTSSSFFHKLNQLFLRIIVIVWCLNKIALDLCLSHVSATIFNVSLIFSPLLCRIYSHRIYNNNFWSIFFFFFFNYIN